MKYTTYFYEVEYGSEDADRHFIYRFGCYEDAKGNYYSIVNDKPRYDVALYFMSVEHDTLYPTEDDGICIEKRLKFYEGSK